MLVFAGKKFHYIIIKLDLWNSPVIQSKIVWSGLSVLHETKTQLIQFKRKKALTLTCWYIRLGNTTGTMSFIHINYCSPRSATSFSVSFSVGLLYFLLSTLWKICPPVPEKLEIKYFNVAGENRIFFSW